MSVDDVYKLEVCGNSGGNWNLVVHHFRADTDSSSNPLQAATDLLNAWQATIQTAWLAMLPSTYQLEGIRAKRVFPNGGPTATIVTPATVGAVSGASASTEIGGCVIFPFSNGTPSRYYCGRTFIPAAPLSYIIDGQIQTAYNSLMLAWANLMTAILTGSLCTWEPGTIVEKPTKHFESYPEYYISGGAGTQRRRVLPLLGKPSRSSHKRPAFTRAAIIAAGKAALGI